MRTRLLLPIFFLSLIILSLHLFALRYFFYWTHWWFDILVHSLGGILIAWIAISLFERFGLSKTRMVLVCGFFVPLLISIGWEIFEYASGVTYFSSRYTLDTTLDISMGVIGGMVGALFSVYFFQKFISQEHYA